MLRYCLECGGELVYDTSLKQFACKSCGLIFTYQQLMEGKNRIIDESFEEEDKKKKKQQEYLKW